MYFQLWSRNISAQCVRMALVRLRGISTFPPRRFSVCCVLIGAGAFAPGGAAAAQSPWPPRSDTAFYDLARGFVTDSMWANKPPAGTSFFATSGISLNLLRAVAVPADSVGGSANIVCPNSAAARASGAGRSNQPRAGYVLSFNMVQDDSVDTFRFHLSAGCRSEGLDSGRGPPLGHSCGWQLRRSAGMWRVLRSLGCYFT
jgi:hypothetical protein